MVNEKKSAAKIQKMISRENMSFDFGELKLRNLSFVFITFGILFFANPAVLSNRVEQRYCARL